MVPRILLSTPAQKQFQALDARTRDRVRKALTRFAGTGRGDVKRLQGVSGGEHLFRLRIGDLRIIYRETEKDLQVIQILNRSQAYSWL